MTHLWYVFSTIIELCFWWENSLIFYAFLCTRTIRKICIAWRTILIFIFELGYVEDWMSMKLHDFLVEPCLFLKVLSRSGKAEVLTSPHRPYGSNQASLQEIKRIREAGGWVCFPCSFIFSHSFWPSSVVNILYYYMSIFNIVKIEVLIWKLWQLRMRTNLSYLGYETIFSFLVLLFMYCGLVVRETKTCNTVCFPQWNHSQILSSY